MELLDIGKLRERRVLRERDEVIRTRRLSEGSVGESFDVVTRGERHVIDGRVIWVRRVGRLDRFWKWLAGKVIL